MIRPRLKAVDENNDEEAGQGEQDGQREAEDHFALVLLKRCPSC